jgi:hypothetical protein
MRWQYAQLNNTPYLYSSQHLKQLYKESRNQGETEAIWNHLECHEVTEDRQYKGYYSLAEDIREDLYGEEMAEMEWGDILNNYKPVITKNGLQIKRRRTR